MANGLDPEVVRAIGDAAIDGVLSPELVYEPAVIDAITDDELSGLFDDLGTSDERPFIDTAATNPS